jgi:hypothetical protein
VEFKVAQEKEGTTTRGPRALKDVRPLAKTAMFFDGDGFPFIAEVDLPTRSEPPKALTRPSTWLSIT